MKPEHYQEPLVGACCVCANSDEHPYAPWCYKHGFKPNAHGCCEDYREPKMDEPVGVIK
jgi:hypothetical protein